MRYPRLFSLIFCVLLAVLFPGASFGAGTVHVKGYTRKDGTYVAPHDRTAPNSTKDDNWSTKGNVNPETGKPGTKPRDEDLAPSPGADSKTQKTAPKVSPWSKMHAGMTKEEVTALLGDPNLKSATKWYFAGTGWVKFNAQGLVTEFSAG